MVRVFIIWTGPRKESRRRNLYYWPEKLGSGGTGIGEGPRKEGFGQEYWKFSLGPAVFEKLLSQVRAVVSQVHI